MPLVLVDELGGSVEVSATHPRAVGRDALAAPPGGQALLIHGGVEVHDVEVNSLREGRQLTEQELEGFITHGAGLVDRDEDAGGAFALDARVHEPVLPVAPLAGGGAVGAVRHTDGLPEDRFPIHLVAHHLAQLLAAVGGHRTPAVLGVGFLHRVPQDLADLALDQLLLSVTHVAPTLVVIEAVLASVTLAVLDILHLLLDVLVLHQPAHVPVRALAFREGGDRFPDRVVLICLGVHLAGEHTVHGQVAFRDHRVDRAVGGQVPQHVGIPLPQRHVVVDQVHELVDQHTAHLFVSHLVEEDWVPEQTR